MLKQQHEAANLPQSYQRKEADYQRGVQKDVADINYKKAQTDALVNKPAPQTPLQKIDAKIVGNAIESFRKTAPQLMLQKKNLNRMEQLINETSGGLTGARNLLHIPGRAKSELESASAIAIEPIISLMSPRGTIPQRRFENIQKTHQIEASDFKGTALGKLASLKRFYEILEGRQRHFQGLIEKWGSDIPIEELTKYEDENADIVSSFEKINDQSSGTSNGNTLSFIAPDGQQYYIPANDAEGLSLMEEIKAKEVR
jgi:hypothetical protein